MKTALTALLLIASPSARGTPPIGAGAPPAHVTWSLDACARCHAPSEEAALEPRLARPCRTLCATCHEGLRAHHPVGVRIAGRVRAPLLLTENGTNTCSTCHDVTRPRVEATAWASQSLVDRLTRRSRPHRTWLLVVKNDRGQLCRSCH